MFVKIVYVYACIYIFTCEYVYIYTFLLAICIAKGGKII